MPERGRSRGAAVVTGGPRPAGMVVTRVAPSPTGEPHVGTAYVSLFNWAWARRNGGRFLLRIEDTDRARSRPEHEGQILEALAWLGLEPDESPAKGGPCGPYRQSERGAIYSEYAAQLLAGGHAYRCFCTSERLAALREEQKAAKGWLGYDGHCRAVPADASERRAASEPFVVRLRVDRAASTRFRDLLRGEIVIENKEVDDQVLLKSDGMPTYHMANVVDDHLMGVTIIMRAEEWLTSVPKHVMLYDAFGWEPPVFAHVPLLRNADKTKISKRKNPTSLLWYRSQGYLPEALCNFLALQGWRPPEDKEEFTLDELVAAFDPKDISTGGPVFDLAKLDWLNGAKIRALPPEELADRLLAPTVADGGAPGPPFAGDWGRDELLAALPLFRERLLKLSDFLPAARYLRERVEPDVSGLAAKTKKEDPAALAAALRAAADLLEGSAGRPEDEREASLRALAEEHGLKVGALFMGLRVAVTGATASPPLLPSVDLLGAGEAATRIRDLAERLVTVS